MKDIVKHKVIDFCYVTDFVANGSFASLRENVSYINSPDYAVLVRLTDFTKKWSKDFVYVSRASYDFLRKSSLVKGDLIMSNVGEPGIVFLVPDLKQPMTLGPNSILIRPNENTSTSKFLYLYFLSEMGKKQIDDISTGAAQKKFNKTSFRDLEIPLPPLPEQQRIVALLDEAFAAIGKAKANAEQNLKNAKELFDSYLQRVFENKGGDWDEKSLGEVLVKTETIDPTKKPKEEFIYLDVSSVNKETKEIENATVLLGKDAPSRARKLVRTNDVIFATVRPTHSRVALITEEYNEQVCSTGYFVLRAKEFLSNNLVFYFLLTYSFNKQMEKLQKGASYPAVTDSEVKGIYIPFPKSLKEQNKIVQKLDALSTETKKLEAIYTQKINDLEELKKSVLQKAFSGELINNN
jgi:type I restriction enzyme S subunit